MGGQLFETMGYIDTPKTQDGVDFDIADKLDKIARDLKGELGKRILENAAEIYLMEQRRLLAQKYPESPLINLLTVWTKETKRGWRVEVGYPDIVMKTFPHAMVIEFGRPACEVEAALEAKIDRITLAYGQMLAKGKVTGEELRQMTEAGVPLL